MKNKYLKRHIKEHAKSHRRIVTIIDGMFFRLVIIMIIFFFSSGLDAIFPFPQLPAFHIIITYDSA